MILMGVSLAFCVVIYGLDMSFLSGEFLAAS
jgi:hypothetical protein